MVARKLDYEAAAAIRVAYHAARKRLGYAPGQRPGVHYPELDHRHIAALLGVNATTVAALLAGTIYRTGEPEQHRKLTAQDRTTIRARYGVVKTSALAQEYGVSRQRIYQIVKEGQAHG